MRILCFLIITLMMSFISSSEAQAIKIGLIDATSAAYIATSNEGFIVEPKSDRTIYRILPMKAYKFYVDHNNIYVTAGKASYNLNTNFILIRPSTQGFVSVKKAWYRGEILLMAHNNYLTVINNIYLEEYIKGVVPAEMPSKWNIEAHKAQAIAARSYAVANLGKRASHGYDLKDTPEDQAYGGASKETNRTNQACFTTKGIVMTYNKKVIPAYYSASAGGHTKNSGDIWYKDLPYLKSVPSYDDGIKKNGHGIGMSQHGANNLADKGFNAFQILTHFYNNVRFARLDPSWQM